MKSEKKMINKDFMLYLIGRMVSDTGSTIQMMIMPLYIIDIGGTAATIGIFSFLSFLPTLIIYPFAGVLGDRLNRKTIMVVTDLISAGVIMILAILAYWDMLSIGILLVAQVIIILMNGLFEPATRGMLPQLVDQGEATRSNAMVSSMRTASIMVGPVMGAALYAKFGIVMVFIVNGVSFLLSAVSEMMIAYKFTKVKSRSGIIGIFQDLSEGVEFIRSNRTIGLLCLFYLANYMMLQPIFSVILPLLFKMSLKFSDIRYGYVQMIVILGGLVGSIFVGVLFGKDGELRKPLVWGTGFVSAAMMLFTALILPGSISLLGKDTFLFFVSLAGALCLLSISSAFIIIPIQAHIQKETPIQYMSRVFSMMGLLSRGGIPLGALIYGFTLERIALHNTMFSAVLLMIATFTGIIILLLRKTEDLKESNESM
ncbi:MFS transporter [Geosporobacter ferrireducens]|uniref:MFS transporter n=1 Tax=Geosporobacter ferrireducens TaxID=1424294 RepID=A0A1D8GF36_9FIRM|nr:MFS transporter [Geosporobacter ferrireducens]AOT69510.1 MFS transporter [Geosporobacter ferrireducens]